MEFTKLANYLDSFSKEDPNYDLACFIKEKIATDINDRETINNGDDEELEDNDVTMATPDQQSSENTEGDMMSGAFQELDVQNALKEEKEKIHIDNRQKPSDTSHSDTATNEAFADNFLNRKEASLFSLLQNKLKK
jgi:hypothetical protein